VDFVRQRFLPFVDSSDIESVSDVLHLYSVNSLTAATPELSVTSLVSDLRATCPLDEMMRVAASFGHSPVYRFQVQESSSSSSSSSSGSSNSSVVVIAVSVVVASSGHSPVYGFQMQENSIMSSSSGGGGSSSSNLL